MVRFFIEARSWDADSPARVLEQTNAMLVGRLPSDTFVTAFLAVLERRLQRWRAPATCRRLHLSGGQTRELEATGVPLGVDQGAATASASSSWRTATCVRLHRTGCSRRAGAMRPTAASASPGSCRACPRRGARERWPSGCTRRSSPGAAARRRRRGACAAPPLPAAPRPGRASRARRLNGAVTDSAAPAPASTNPLRRPRSGARRGARHDRHRPPRPRGARLGPLRERAAPRRQARAWRCPPTASARR